MTGAGPVKRRDTCGAKKRDGSGEASAVVDLVRAAVARVKADPAVDADALLLELIGGTP